MRRTRAAAGKTKTTRVSSSSGHHSLEEAITIAIATIITDNTIKEGGGHRAARDDDVGVGDNNKCCGKEDKEDGVKISLRDIGPSGPLHTVPA